MSCMFCHHHHRRCRPPTPFLLFFTERKPTAHISVVSVQAGRQAARQAGRQPGAATNQATNQAELTTRRKETHDLPATGTRSYRYYFYCWLSSNNDTKQKTLRILVHHTEVPLPHSCCRKTPDHATQFPLLQVHGLNTPAQGGSPPWPAFVPSSPGCHNHAPA